VTRRTIDDLTTNFAKVSTGSNERKEQTMLTRPVPARLGAAARRLAGAALLGALLLGAAAAPAAAADTDGDGLDDATEAIYGTNPNDKDSDDDGLEDISELHPVLRSNPLDPDTDDDGLTDGNEWFDLATSMHDPDTDDDGVGDAQEVAAGTDPLVANAAPAPPVDPAPAERPDRDGDGLYDDDEVGVYGTDPDDWDTDGDGSSDGEEVYYGTDPLSSY
jgi:hypothetical protein